MSATAVLAPRAPRIMPLSRMGDEALASRAAAGNQAAFTALYERYHGPLLGYCRSILLDAEDASDATQSALENAFRALPRREPGRPLRPWLYRIAHNEAINIVRRRQPVVEGDLDTASMLTVPGPEADAEQRTRLAQLVDDLRTLPERQRGALVMRELSGLSYDEIALALGVSNEAARRAVFDARNALHAAVDGRATECTSVRRTLSDGDRRHLRARGVRAHLRSCDDCATFERSMGTRQADLHALGPWLGGSALLGMIGIGGGGGGGGALIAASSGGAAAAGGGGLWAGLPAAVKGIAVAAVVATTGTAAVEIPKVAAPDAPAPATREATVQAAIAPASVSRDHNAVREQALAQAAAARRARARRARAARRAAAPRMDAGTGSVSQATIDRGASPARPATTAPATIPAATPAPAVATKPTVAKAPARTEEQIAEETLQRIRDKIAAAFASAQTIADSGTQGAIATANNLIQNTLDQVMPSLQRILASLGLSMPTTTSTAPSTTQTNTTITNVLEPAQSLLSGVNSLLHNLFGGR